MARYIGRYVKHPPIAESRIMVFDGKQLTFWYKDSETKQKCKLLGFVMKVISEAAKIGMNREQTISYIEHLKQYGYAYEPIKGEIRCAF